MEHSNPLRDLTVIGTNVIAVTTDDQLMVYEPATEKFTNVDHYNRALHVQRGSKTNELFIVRNTLSEQLILEIVETLEGVPSNNPLKSYELMVESVDTRAQFSIRRLTVDSQNERFLSNFLGFTTLSDGDEILLIAINNNLYWLQQHESGESDLIVVRCFASAVTDFNFSENGHHLTVLLEAGVLVVFNQSLNTDALLVSSSSVYLQAPIEAYAFDEPNGTFLYSNGLSLHRLHFQYSETSCQFLNEAEEFPIRGVVAITLPDDNPAALLLTENNLFYAIDRTPKKRTDTNDASKMFVLGREMRTATKRVTKMLTDEVHFDKRLEEAIHEEQTKFNVLALHRNRVVFEKLSEMEINFHNEMPPRKANMLLLGNRLDRVCLFASVKITINLGYFDLLNQQKRWSIFLGFYENSVTYPVHETFDRKGVLHALVFLSKNDLATGLPRFRSFLLTTVKHGNENLLLTIPVPTVNDVGDECAVNLIQNAECTLQSAWNDQCVTLAARNIIFKNNPVPVEPREEIRQLSYCIRNDQSKTKAISFSDVLENNAQDTWSVLDESVKIGWHGEKAALCVKTCHPVAMDLVKRFLFADEDYGSEMEQRRAKLKGIVLELQAVNDAALIVHLYRRVRNDGMIEDDLVLSSSI